MRLSRAEAKRIALSGAARRAAVRRVEDSVRDELSAPVERMSRRRLKAFHEARARTMVGSR